jgi:hypothetical protein
MVPRRIFPILILILIAGCGGKAGPGMGGGSGGSGGSGGAGGNGVGPSVAAYAWVSTSSSGSYAISGYSASASGVLTPVSGSPFATSGYGPLSMVANGSILFGADGYSIYSFSIGSDGAIKQTHSFPAGHLSSSSPPAPIGGPVNLFFDPSGSTLYDGFANIDGTENNGYQALSFDSSGAISLIGNAGSSPALDGVLAFSANDQFAYTSSCYHGIPTISSFTRGSNGALTALASSTFSAMPPAPNGDSYCPSGAATDVSNHLIVSVGVTPPEMPQSTGPWQLATYAIDGSGDVTTSSTSSSMPTTNVGQPVSYQLSPDSKYLAIGGQSGVQVYAYSSSTGAISALGTGSALTSDTITQVAWDSDDHLYALSSQANSLYVFAVSSSGAASVSGSPYAVQGAYAMTVAAAGS